MSVDDHALGNVVVHPDLLAEASLEAGQLRPRLLALRGRVAMPYADP